MHFFVKTQSLRALLWQRRQYKKNPQRSRQSLVHSWGRQRRSLLQKQLYRNQALAILSPVITDAQTLLSHWFPTFRAYRYLFKGRFPLRRIRPRDQAMCYQGMRGSKSKMKASVYWRTLGQFWKLNQVQLFATRMSENQSVCFFSMIEHAIVPVRATKFAEVETGLKARYWWGGSRI